MRVTLVGQSAYTAAYCHLALGESVLVERDGMAAMDIHLDVSATTGPGGVGKAVLRKALGQETFFMGKYTAQVEGAWVLVAPKYPGDMTVATLERGPLMVSSGCLLAVEQAVEIDVRFAGLDHLVMHEGATMLKLTGHGQALLATYGGIEVFDLDAGQSVAVKSSHFVAADESMNIRVVSLGGLANGELAADGLACLVTGPGRLYIQTRAESGLRNWLEPERHARRSGRE